MKSPEWLPLEFDAVQGTAILMRMSEESYRASSFLDYRAAGTHECRSIAITELADRFCQTSTTDRTKRFLFHTGYCCSTFLSRCLDHSSTLILREPLILHGLARIRLGVSPETQDYSVWSELLNLTMAMLARTYRQTQDTLIKLDCNQLWAELARPRQATKSVFVYQPLEDFLASVFKRPERRDWFRSRLPLLKMMASDTGCTGISNWMGDIETTPSDAGSATAFWIWNTHCFYERASSGGDLRSLHCDRMVQDPLSAARAVRDYLDLDIPDRTLTKLVSRALHIHAKDDSISFSPDLRDKELSSLKQAYREEILHGMALAGRLVGAFDERLPAPLL